MSNISDIPILNTDYYLIPEAHSITTIGSEKTATVAIILRSEDHELHNPLLHNILKAIQIDVEKDVLFFLIQKGQSVHISTQIKEGIEQVMCFGLGIKDIGMHASFQANTFYPTESYKIMLTHSLAKLDADKMKKKHLWTALQNNFLNT